MEDELQRRITQARTAVAAACYADALALLDGCEQWPLAFAESGALVKADALSRGDAVAASLWLTATDELVCTDEGRFERELLAGRAATNVRNYTTAQLRFARAQAYTEHVDDGVGRLAYHRARLRWFEREAQPDDADLALAVASTHPARRASALIIRAWVHAGLGDYHRQIDDLSAALALYEQSRETCDVGSAAITIHSLARVSFEIAHQEGVAAALHAYEWLRWSDDVRVDRFQALRALGTDAFMRGDSARAQWRFRDAASLAPSPAWQVVARLDRAYVARVSQNEPWALDELADALNLARGVAWAQTTGEERLALVALAELLAPVDPAEAQRCAATYSMLGTQSVSPRFAISTDRRAVGFEQYAFGRVEQMAGNRESAEAALTQAYEIFAPIDHQYRAMLAASALAELTADPVWFERTRDHLAWYPGSPIAAKAELPSRQAMLIPSDLSPFEVQLARAHWSGFDRDELSRRFSRSRFTVDRHIATIYQAFAVDSQPALRDEALRRGLA